MFNVDGRLFGENTKPFLIAEVGHNHQGNIETAVKLIHAAAESGATAVKFQKRDNKNLFTQQAFDTPYINENSFGSTYGEHRMALEFNKDQYRVCIEEAKKCGITFFSTAFDIQSADFLADLDMPAYKIASGDLKNLPLIEYVAKLGKPIIISTGGSNLDEVEMAVSTASNFSNNIALLQCTAGYPPEYSELNLNVITTYRNKFPEITIGYSGHDSGIAMSLVAYVLGARVIEKHFTLNRAMKGTDHSFSLEPQGLRKLVRDLERTQAALGDGIKQIYESEKAPILKMGKSIYFRRAMSQGEKITREDVCIKSPGSGLPPTKLGSIVGKYLNTDVEFEELVTLDHLVEL